MSANTTPVTATPVGGEGPAFGYITPPPGARAPDDQTPQVGKAAARALLFTTPVEERRRAFPIFTVSDDVTPPPGVRTLGIASRALGLPVRALPLPPLRLPPAKRDRVSSTPEELFIENARQLESRDYFLRNGARFVVIPNPRMMSEGQHAFLALLGRGQPECVEGVSNENVLVKSYREYAGTLGPSPTTEELRKAKRNAPGPNEVRHALRQYDSYLSVGCPAATIYNLEDARRGCGYFLVEFVPYPFTPRWTGDSVPAEAVKQLVALGDLFRITHAVKETLPDLKISNLRSRDETGFPVLIDFREKSVDADEVDAEWNGACRDCSNGNDNVTRFLQLARTAPNREVLEVYLAQLISRPTT